MPPIPSSWWRSCWSRQRALPTHRRTRCQGILELQLSAQPVPGAMAGRPRRAGAVGPRHSHSSRAQEGHSGAPAHPPGPSFAVPRPSPPSEALQLPPSALRMRRLDMKENFGDPDDPTSGTFNLGNYSEDRGELAGGLSTHPWGPGSAQGVVPPAETSMSPAPSPGSRFAGPQTQQESPCRGTCTSTMQGHPAPKTPGSKIESRSGPLRVSGHMWPVGPLATLRGDSQQNVPKLLRRVFLLPQKFCIYKFILRKTGRRSPRGSLLFIPPLTRKPPVPTGGWLQPCDPAHPPGRPAGCSQSCSGFE